MLKSSCGGALPEIKRGEGKGRYMTNVRDTFGGFATFIWKGVRETGHDRECRRTVGGGWGSGLSWTNKTGGVTASFTREKD